MCYKLETEYKVKMDIEKINVKLSSALERKGIKAKLEKEYSIVKAKFETENEHTLELLKNLKKEEHDVDRLEKMSLSSLFYTILGSKEKQLEKERQEMLATQLKYEQSKFITGKLRDELMYLQSQIKSYKTSEQDYDQAIQEKEVFLKESKSPVAKKIIDLETNIAKRNFIVRETNEAIMAGANVIGRLGKIIEYLDSAQNWGTWDMLGGGLWATSIKHSNIDLAKSEIYGLEPSMNKFKRKLSDVGGDISIELEIGGFATFADYFFDGLIADWVVQSKINNSLNQAYSAQKAVKGVLDRLVSRKNQLQEEILTLANKKYSLIENYK